MPSARASERGRTGLHFACQNLQTTQRNAPACLPDFFVYIRSLSEVLLLHCIWKVMLQCALAATCPPLNTPSILQALLRLSLHCSLAGLLTQLQLRKCSRSRSLFVSPLRSSVCFATIVNLLRRPASLYECARESGKVRSALPEVSFICFHLINEKFNI